MKQAGIGSGPCCREAEKGGECKCRIVDERTGIDVSASVVVPTGDVISAGPDCPCSVEGEQRCESGCHFYSSVWRLLALPYR